MNHYIRCNKQQDEDDALLNDCSSGPPNPPKSITLEKQLFHALHENRITSIKEFKEAWAMANAVRKFLGDKVEMEHAVDVVGKVF